MRDARNVVVQRAIVHIIDNANQQMTLSEAEIDLGGRDGALRDYFSSQIQNALRDSQTGSARFSGDGDKSASKECFRILKDPGSLIDASQKLAGLLLAAMGGDKRIAQGSLAACLYSSENYPKASLALIKLDPGRGLVQKVEKTASGKRVVNFHVRKDVMPTANEKLRKAALVPRRGTDETFDLLLLDRQAAGVANFFAQAFLNAEPARDAQSNATSFYEVGQRAYNHAMKNTGNPDSLADADVILRSVESTLPGAEVDLDDWLKKLPVSAATRDHLAGEIGIEFPEEKTIVVDANFAKAKLLRKRRFRGGHGVSFEVDSDYYDDVVTINGQTDENGIIVTELTLRVPGLQWVS
jgi:hypothetical protein